MESKPGPLKGTQGGVLQRRFPRRLSKMRRSETSYARPPAAASCGMIFFTTVKRSTSLSTPWTSLSIPPRHMRAASRSRSGGFSKTGSWKILSVSPPLVSKLGSSMGLSRFWKVGSLRAQLGELDGNRPRRREVDLLHPHRPELALVRLHPLVARASRCPLPPLRDSLGSDLDRLAVRMGHRA